MLTTTLGLLLYLPNFAKSLADSFTHDSSNNAVSDSDYINSKGTMTSEERTEKVSDRKQAKHNLGQRPARKTG